MKVAVISDIHANPEALENALADAKAQGCQQIVCLGDIVGYGYDPGACIDIIKDNNIKCCLGNHDAGLIGKLSLEWFSETAKYGIMWQRGKTTDAQKDFLRSLPYAITEEFNGKKVVFAHGTMYLPEKFYYIQDAVDARYEMASMGKECDYLFVGHTHCAEAYGIDHKEGFFIFGLYNAPDLSIKLTNYRHIIANVGSVGYPRVQRKSHYIIYDTNEHKISFRTLAFNFYHYVSNMENHSVKIPMWLKSYMEPDANPTQKETEKPRED